MLGNKEATYLTVTGISELFTVNTKKYVTKWNNVAAVAELRYDGMNDTTRIANPNNVIP
jgi:hypothetical protein